VNALTQLTHQLQQALLLLNHLNGFFEISMSLLQILKSAQAYVRHHRDVPPQAPAFFEVFQPSDPWSWGKCLFLIVGGERFMLVVGGRVAQQSDEDRSVNRAVE